MATGTGQLKTDAITVELDEADTLHAVESTSEASPYATPRVTSPDTSPGEGPVVVDEGIQNAAKHGSVSDLRGGATKSNLNASILSLEQARAKTRWQSMTLETISAYLVSPPPSSRGRTIIIIL